MAEVVGMEVLFDPKWLLLITGVNEDWPRHTKQWLSLAAVVTKRNITKAWGTTIPPTLEDWESDMDWC